jgi:hypothetical protein
VIVSSLVSTPEGKAFPSGAAVELVAYPSKNLCGIGGYPASTPGFIALL